MNSEIYYEMKRCKMDWMDDIFNGTKDSQGMRNATNAIKFVLFDDLSVLPDGIEIGDKYEFISSRKDGRAKAKMLQPIDCIQILCRYALESFGILNKKWEITYDDYEKLRQTKVMDREFTHEYIVELVSLALCDSIYGAYLFIVANPMIKNALLSSFLNERYIEAKEEELDQFDGTLNPEIFNYEEMRSFKNAYNHLDDAFLNIKRRDTSYVNYEKNI